MVNSLIEEDQMSVEETEQTVRAYLEALLGGSNFAKFFSDDVL